MIVTFPTVRHVIFPVFNLPNGNVHYSSGLTLFEDGKILDDRNVKGTNLARRRLRTKHQKELFKLKNKCDHLGDMLISSSNFFIDSKGRVFEYQRTQTASLKYHIINRVEYRDIDSKLYVSGISTTFVVPRPPAIEQKYVGILYLYTPWLVYEYCSYKKKNTYRRV